MRRRSKKHRLQVSKDNGKTWKRRLVDIYNFDPSTNRLKPGDLIQTTDGIRRVKIVEGRLEALERVTL